jgi:hypothetical protein
VRANSKKPASGKKTMRVATTFTGVAACAVFMAPAAMAGTGRAASVRPSHHPLRGGRTLRAAAIRDYEIRILAWGLNMADPMTVCGNNQHGTWVCDNAVLLPGGTIGSEQWSTPNWWWSGSVGLYWSDGKSYAFCDVQSQYHSGNYAILGTSKGNTNC